MDYSIGMKREFGDSIVRIGFHAHDRILLSKSIHLNFQIGITVEHFRMLRMLAACCIAPV